MRQQERRVLKCRRAVKRSRQDRRQSFEALPELESADVIADAVRVELGYVPAISEALRSAQTSI